VIDGLTVTKMANEGGDYATVLGTLCLASGQHAWNVYINHVEDSNLFIGQWLMYGFGVQPSKTSSKLTELVISLRAGHLTLCCVWLCLHCRCPQP
jgi:hypothetical protein